MKQRRQLQRSLCERNTGASHIYCNEGSLVPSTSQRAQCNQQTYKLCQREHPWVEVRAHTLKKTSANVFCCHSAEGWEWAITGGWGRNRQCWEKMINRYNKVKQVQPINPGGSIRYNPTSAPVAGGGAGLPAQGAKAPRGSHPTAQQHQDGTAHPNHSWLWQPKGKQSSLN